MLILITELVEIILNFEAIVLENGAHIEKKTPKSVTLGFVKYHVHSYNSFTM